LLPNFKAFFSDMIRPLALSETIFRFFNLSTRRLIVSTGKLRNRESAARETPNFISSGSTASMLPNFRSSSAVCTENLNTGVVVVKSAQDGA
jgi:hypothetical protein